MWGLFSTERDIRDHLTLSMLKMQSDIPLLPGRWSFKSVDDYHKIPKYSDTRKIAVIILKFEQFGFTIE